MTQRELMSPVLSKDFICTPTVPPTTQREFLLQHYRDAPVPAALQPRPLGTKWLEVLFVVAVDGVVTVLSLSADRPL